MTIQNNSTDESLIESSFSTGPGDRLRQVRQSKQLSISEVASHLHLREELIDALERDDYQQAPQFVFIRGYLRAYAKYLELSGDDIVAAFDSLNLPEPASGKQVWQPQSESPFLIRDRFPRPMILFVGVVVIAIMSFWWMGRSRLSPEPTPNPAIHVSEKTDVPGIQQLTPVTEKKPIASEKG